MTRVEPESSRSSRRQQRLGKRSSLRNATSTPKTDISASSREDNTIISVNSGYGGNVLLGKKCFALRIASYQGWKEGWMAEHMLILGLENPAGRSQLHCGCVPVRLRQDQPCNAHSAGSICAKKDTRFGLSATISLGCVSVPDGRLYAINPENGFFGVAPGTNEQSNFNALASTKQEHYLHQRCCIISTDNTVWWEGLDKETPPKNAIDWKGNPWDPAKFVKPTRPLRRLIRTRRFTAPAKNCPCISSEFDNGAGVPISAIIFGGRRAKTRSAGISVQRLGERCIRRFHHGIRDHRCRGRRCRRSSP